MNSVQMKFKKTLAWILFVICFACTSAGASINVPANARALTGETEAVLSLPSSYEQYLNLTNPVDIALSKQYIAIADKNTLYLYDRETDGYTKSDVPNAGENSTISKIGFADERLFISVRAASNSFYEYNFVNKEFKSLSMNCSTFFIDGSTLYTANVGGSMTTIASYSIANLQLESSSHDLGTINQHSTPSMAILGNQLYCTFNNYVYSIDPANGSFNSAEPFYLSSVPSDTINVQSTCVYENALYYTASGGLYRADFPSDKTSGQAVLLLAGDDFGALTAYDGMLYAVKGNSVVGIEIGDTGATLTGYEIAAASDSVNRLSGAVDTARAGNLLVTADAGNHRVSVMDMRTGQFSVLRPGAGEGVFTPDLVATDGDLIAVAAGGTVYTCRWGEETLTRAYTAPSKVQGLACVYGSVYYVTSNAVFGKLGTAETVVQEQYGLPTAMASDLYGDLFVAYGTDVYRFTERNFLTDGSGERLSYSLPENATCLRADFDGNLYCLADGCLFENGEFLFGGKPAAPFVYGGDADMPLSFALGFEDDVIYLLFGNYLVKTVRGYAAIPTLDTIPSGGVREQVFAVHEAERLFIDIPAGSIGVKIDLAALKEDPACFPYLSYSRTAADARGVLLAEKDDYALVLLYEEDGNSRAYTAALFRMPEELSPVPKSEYWEVSASDMYLSNDVSAYDFPCLETTLAETRLARGTLVKVLGTVHAAERDYALIEYRTDARTTARGYVPLTYLTPVKPMPEEGVRYEPAWLKASKDGVTFTAEDGQTIVVTERTRAEFLENDDGTFTARIYREGKEFRATVTDPMIDRGESDALRISLIVILTVIAALIVGAYFYLAPRRGEDREL